MKYTLQIHMKNAKLGSNKNINRECWLYLPKSKSFAPIRDEEVEEIEEALHSKLKEIITMENSL